MADPGIPSMSIDRRISRYARVAGALYIVLFVLAPFVFLFGKAAALVPDDPAATAENVAAMGTQFRLDMLIEATIFLVEIILAALLYVIFRPVHHAISLAAAFARLAEAIVQGVNLLTSILVLLVLGGAGYAAVFTTPQLEALAHLFLSANAFVVLVWGIFFGFHLLLFGYLVYESTFLPKWLGVLLVIAGTGYPSAERRNDPDALGQCDARRPGSRAGSARGAGLHSLVAGEGDPGPGAEHHRPGRAKYLTTGRRRRQGCGYFRECRMSAMATTALQSRKP
jgi:hypothetical protein